MTGDGADGSSRVSPGPGRGRSDVDHAGMDSADGSGTISGEVSRDDAESMGWQAPPTASRVVGAAFFDVDGTLVSSTIVHYYAFFRRADMGAFLGRVWSGLFLMKCLGYLVLDKVNRSWFNRLFYRNYHGLRAERVRGLAEACYREVMEPRRFHEGAAEVSDHRLAGRRVVLVTGSIDFLVEPLARALGADDVVAPELVEREGLFTGELDGPAVGEREKARRLTAYARAHGIDLSASYAYGDSIADLPMLESVGHPVVVNPDPKLAAMARRRGWPMKTWTLDGRRGDRAS